MLAMPTSAAGTIEQHALARCISYLPNRMMTAERDPRDQRDQPGVLEEPAERCFGSEHRSALHLRELVERDALAVAVDQQHHRQADADLGGGDRDDVQREHVAVERCRCSG